MSKEQNHISFFQSGNIEVVRGRSRHSFPKHSHRAFCIGMVIDGTIRLNIEEQEYYLGKNNVYLIPPFTGHTISAIKNRQYSYVVICISNETTDRLSKAVLQKYVYKAEDEMGITVFDLFRKYEHSHDSQQLEGELLQVLNRVIKKVHHRRQVNDKVTGLVISYIKEQLGEEIDLREISERTHVSKFHLVRLFKKQMGVTPYQYYLQEKIKRIKQGLISKNPSIDLACEFSFADQSHLCNTFKKHVGITPTQYQNNYKEVED